MRPSALLLATCAVVLAASDARSAPIEIDEFEVAPSVAASGSAGDLELVADDDGDEDAPPRREKSEGQKVVEDAGRRTLACGLTMGLLSCVSVLGSIGSLFCGLGVVLCISGLAAMLQAYLIYGVVLVGMSLGSCVFGGLFAFVAAGVLGVGGGYLRSVGLWSWEAQQVFWMMGRFI